MLGASGRGLWRHERIAITVKLKEGSEARARDLVAAGPPFDPSRAGLTQHGVFVGPDFVVFVFEGEDVVEKAVPAPKRPP